MKLQIRKRESLFFILIFLLILFVVVAGFSRTYFVPMIQKTFVAKPLVHIHATLFSMWIVLTIIQPLLVRSRNTRLHQKIGVAGFLLASSMIIIGCVFAVTVARLDIGTENEQMAKAFLFIPLTDMLLFSIFIGASYLNRRNPDYHKRLILLATISLLPAAFSRIPLFIDIATTTNLFVALLIMDSFLFVGILYDIIESRRVHPAYIFGGAVLLLVHFSRMFVMETKTWLKISEFIVG